MNIQRDIIRDLGHNADDTRNVIHDTHSGVNGFLRIATKIAIPKFNSDAK